MSDFCRWITAAEPGLPWKPGTFLTAYRRKMEDANTDLAEDDSVASAMVDWVDANLRAGASREMVAKDLLIQLNHMMADTPKDMRATGHPVRGLAYKLVRLAPVLRAQGIEVRRLPRQGRRGHAGKSGVLVSRWRWT